MKKERPILMSSPMVIATIEGNKTMTRRQVKAGFDNVGDMDFNGIQIYENESLSLQGYFRPKDTGVALGVQCPYGKPGDILWVRESFTNGYEGILDDPKMKYWTFKADGDQIYSNGDYSNSPCKPNPENKTKWKPSIRMPKSIARIWLEVTDVRVERLWEITPEESIKEGVSIVNHKGELRYKNYTVENYPLTCPKVSFSALWQSINGDESWLSNPWVWVISFKVLSTTGRPESLNEPDVQECDATNA